MAKLEQDPEFVLSRTTGFGRHPRDFDFHAKSVPCQVACPAGTDVPGYLEAITDGDFDRAYRINLRDNVFPAVLGRVCTRPCEPACRHGWEGLGEPVAICWAKRAADDHISQQPPTALEPLFLPSGKRVNIVGGGAAGLTAARELALWGHEVHVYEKHEEAGGMMIQGIPEFRLPRDVVRREVQQVINCGIELHCNADVGGEISVESLRESGDAVILSAGTFLPNQPDIPGIDLPSVQHGVGFLKEINAGAAPELGDRVVVIGGGFTAVDCVRIARRLGSENVGMYYRRRAEDSYIPAEEFEQLPGEGIDLHFQAQPIAIEMRDGVTVVRFARTVCEGTSLQATEETFEVEADIVLLGTGQAPNLAWLDEAFHEVAQPNQETSIDWLFVAGDFGTGPSSLIDSIGHAKVCARAVDRFLMKANRFEEGVLIEEVGKTTTGRTKELDLLPRLNMSEKPIEARALRQEVELGLSLDASQEEASRCYLCNYKFEIDNELCIYCDRCLKVMPVEKCIARVSNLIFDESDRIAGYQESSSSRDYNLLFIDSSQCTRCGACVDVCPVDCISLQKVTRTTRPKKNASGAIL